MDIEDIKKRKEELEKKIYEDIQLFEKECGLNIFSIRLKVKPFCHQTEFGNIPMFKRPELEIEIEIRF